MILDFAKKYERKYYFENAQWIKNYNVTYDG